MVFCEQLELPEGSLTRRRGRREYAGGDLPNDDEATEVCSNRRSIFSTSS